MKTPNAIFLIILIALFFSCGENKKSTKTETINGTDTTSIVSSTEVKTESKKEIVGITNRN